MAAQYLDDWSPTIIVAGNTALRDVLDSHATDPATVTIHDEDDVLLAQIMLQKPCGTVNGATGQLPLQPDGREEAAPAGGIAAYVTIRGGGGEPHRSLPCEAGVDPVSGRCVLNTLTIVQGGPVEIVSLVID